MEAFSICTYVWAYVHYYWVYWAGNRFFILVVYSLVLFYYWERFIVSSIIDIGKLLFDFGSFWSKYKKKTKKCQKTKQKNKKRIKNHKICMIMHDDLLFPRWAGAFSDDELDPFQTSSGKNQFTILIVNLLVLYFSDELALLQTSWLRGWPIIFSCFFYSYF